VVVVGGGGIISFDDTLKRTISISAAIHIVVNHSITS
jgi:hypothetical protein